MGMAEAFDGMVEEKLLNLHVAFIGRVVSISKPTVCSVQPLDKIKAYGKSAKAQAVITNVPICNHVRRYSLVKQSLTVQDTYTGGGSISPNPHPTEKNVGHLKVEPLRAGDIVLCVCCDRDIASSRKGGSTTPPVGRHELKDAVVVGWLGGWDHE